MPSAPKTPEANKKNKTRKTPLPPVQCNQNAGHASDDASDDDDEESYTMCAPYEAQFDGLQCKGGGGVAQHKYPTLPKSLQPASGGDEPHPKTPHLPASGSDEPHPKTPPLPASGGGNGGAASDA